MPVRVGLPVGFGEGAAEDAGAGQDYLGYYAVGLVCGGVGLSAQVSCLISREWERVAGADMDALMRVLRDRDCD